MARGGKRDNAGRKSTWESGCKLEDTKLIRVPKRIADQVLEIAHKIDAGESLILEKVIEKSSESQIEQLDFLGENQERLIRVPLAIETPVALYVERLKASLNSNEKTKNRFGLVCPRCKSVDICKHGFNNTLKSKKQAYKCKTCGRRFSKYDNINI